MKPSEVPLEGIESLNGELVSGAAVMHYRWLELCRDPRFGFALPFVLENAFHQQPWAVPMKDDCRKSFNGHGWLDVNIRPDEYILKVRVTKGVEQFANLPALIDWPIEVPAETVGAGNETGRYTYHLNRQFWVALPNTGGVIALNVPPVSFKGEMSFSGAPSLYDGLGPLQYADVYEGTIIVANLAFGFGDRSKKKNILLLHLVKPDRSN